MRSGTSLARCATVVAIVLAVLAAPGHGPVGSAAAKSSVLSTWEQFRADRPQLLRALAPPIIHCSLRNDHSSSTLFRGCVDWHSAVHGAYALHAISHRTGDPTYRNVVEPFITPEAIANEPLPTFELPYGYAWFLALVREREQSTGKRDLHGLADTVAARMATWFSTMDDVLRALTIVDPAVGPPYPGAGLFGGYRNYSWGLIHLYDWAKYTNNDSLLATVHEATTELMDPQWDALCPPAQDASPVSPPLSFMPPCLMRVAAVAHVLGAAAKEWVTVRTAGIYVAPIVAMDPVTGGAGFDCHRGGQNFYRAFTLYPIYRATGNTINRDNYVDLILYMMTRSDIWNGNYCHSHWIAQVGVRAIALSYAPTPTLEYVGETVIANGEPVVLAARLREGDNGAGIPGRTVRLTLGSGDAAQSCTDETDASGLASCTVAGGQPNGPGTVAAAFAGDSPGGVPVVAESVPYEAVSTSVPTIVFDYVPGGGAFVIGDRNASVGNAVTFWSKQWAKANTLSRTQAPGSFKGFAPNPPRATCGDRWSTGHGSSAAPPPAPLPGYIAVLAASSARQSSSTLRISGDTSQLVIVRTDPGYSPSLSGTGTGTVVTSVCSVLADQQPQVTIAAPADGGLVDPGDQISYRIAISDLQDGSTDAGSIDCAAVTVELLQADQDEPVDTQRACTGTFTIPPDAADVGFVVRASYTDKGSSFVAPLSDVAEIDVRLKRLEPESADPAVTTQPTSDPQSTRLNDEDVVLSAGSAVSLGLADLDRLTGVRFRAVSGSGSLELHSDLPAGPLLASASLAGSEWRTASAPLAAAGSHVLFLVARGDVRVNWLEFQGAGAASNQRPRVTAALSPETGEPPLAVHFSGQATDAEGDAVTYSWEFGDGQGASQASADYVYHRARTYRPRLTVRDARGAIWSDTFEVVVTAPPIVCDPASSTPGTDDGFAGTRLDGCRWNAVVRPDFGGMFVHGGALNIDVQDGTFDLVSGVLSPSRLVKNLVLQKASPVEEWTIETKFEAPLVGGNRVGLIVYQDDQTWVQLYVRAPSSFEGTDYVVTGTSRRPDTVFSSTWTTRMPNAGTTWWLRLGKRGATYTTEVSTDGSTWKAFAPSGATNTSAVNPAITEPKIGPLAYGGSFDAPTTTAAIDYIKVTKP